MQVCAEDSTDDGEGGASDGGGVHAVASLDYRQWIYHVRLAVSASEECVEKACISHTSTEEWWNRWNVWG